MSKIQIIEMVVTLLVFIVLRLLVNVSIDKMVANNKATKTRSKIIKKALHITMLFIFITISLSILGIDQSELATFLGSFLTVTGIAFFAQWSILSNITSGIIIFFNHFVRLDDTISVIDKDYEVTGRVSDMGLLFIVLKTETGEKITIPNNMIVQKMIKKIHVSS